MHGNSGRLLRLGRGRWLGVAHRHYDYSLGQRTHTHYTHVFYVLDASTPGRVGVERSPEFCIESAEIPGDCETTQFVSGMLRPAREADALWLLYGANDCGSLRG